MPSIAAASLELASIADGHAGITWAGAMALVEAAAVCLDDRRHAPGVILRVDRARHTFTHHEVVFARPTLRARRANADLQDAVESGAIAIAVAWLMSETDYRIVERSRKGTGFDYWLGRADCSFDARLEVSGILSGDSRALATRLREKLRQMTPSDAGGLPGYAIVVEFGAPCAAVGEK